MSFFALPRDIQFYVLSLLPITDLCHLFLGNKVLSTIRKENDFWQRRGMIEFGQEFLTLPIIYKEYSFREIYQMAKAFEHLSFRFQINTYQYTDGDRVTISPPLIRESHAIAYDEMGNASVGEYRQVVLPVDPIKNILEVLKKCRCIDFCYAHLVSLPKEIGSLKIIETLRLHFNPFTDVASLYSLSSLIHLKTLDLGETLLTHFPMKEIFSHLTKLEHLSVSTNKIETIPIEILSLKELRILNLSYNQLIDLPPSIGSLEKLETLKVNGNKIHSLPKEIGHLGALRYLNCSQNKLIALPPEIGRLQNLTVFYVHLNQLTQLPEEIGEMKQLEDLDISSNQFRELPDSMSRLRHLERIFLNFNPFSLEKELKKIHCKQIYSDGHMYAVDHSLNF